MKKISKTILLGIALSCCIAANGATLKGDINGDGSLSIIDVSLLVSHVLGESMIDNPDIADMNGDKEVNITDVMLLVNAIMNHEDNNPGTEDDDANPDLPVLTPKI